MDSTAAVIAWLRRQFPDARIGLMRDAGTYERGTQGFTIRGDGDQRVLEVTEEFLDDTPAELVSGVLERRRVAAALVEHPAATVIVSTTGLRFKEN